MTFVPADRQKIMLRGNMIKDDTKWTEVKNLTNNCTFILMGTAENDHINLKKATNNKNNIGDENESNVKISVNIKNQIGLSNLGNTC